MRRLAAVPVAVLAVLLAACATPPSRSRPAVATSVTPAAQLRAAEPPAAAAPRAGLAPVSLGEYDGAARADAAVKAALAAAARDGKPVLVDFGADWCPDCVVLGKLAAKPQNSALLSRFHLVSVDVGDFDRNLGVARKLTVNLRTSGIPALVVLDAKGKVRTVTNDGSFSHARRMSAADLASFLKKWE